MNSTAGEAAVGGRPRFRSRATAL